MSLMDSAYRACLQLLPWDVRREFGDDMVQMFRDQRKACAGRPIRLIGLGLHAFGDVLTESVKARAESRRPMQFRGRSLMRAFIHDLQHGLRLLRRTPATSLLAVAALALGIGASTAIFSVVDAVMLRELPYPRPDRLVLVWERRPAEGVLKNVVSPADFIDWRKRQEPFEHMAAYTETTVTVSGYGDAVQVGAGVVSADFFDVLGVGMQWGRTFQREDEIFGRHRVVILTHGFWTRVFGADPSAIGKTIGLNGAAWQVVGVLPQSFRFSSGELDMWAPTVLETPEAPAPRQSHQLRVYARLKDGVSLDQTREAMDRLGKQLEVEYPNENRGHTAWVTTLREEFVGPVETSLVVLFVAVGLVLVIACTNVASLQLARSIGRQREMAVRSALGASRWRLLGQSLTEHLALSVIGGLAGVVVAWITLRGLPLVLPEQLSVVDIREVTLDVRVLGFAAVMALMTSAVVGLMPALSASRQNAIDTIKTGGRGHVGVRRRFRAALVIGEVTLATLALVGAGLVIRSFVSTMSQPFGFDTSNRLTFGVAIPNTRYPTPEQRRSALNDLESRLKTLPNVTSVGAVNFLPLGGGDARTGITIEGREVREGEPPARMHPRVVTPTYFSTMNIPIVSGRGLTEADALESEPVVMISQASVRRFFPDESPIGKRLQFGGDNVWRTIVGVAGDVKHWGLRLAVNPVMYVPQAQRQFGFLSFVLKTNGDPMVIAPAVRAQVKQIDPLLAPGELRTLDEVVGESIRSERAQTVLMSVFALLALALAVLGIYGITSQLVAVRIPEIGVRMTLGARPRDVLRQFVGEGLRQTAIGLVLGLVAGAWLMRMADTLLFEISPWDPITLAAVAGTLLLASLLACVIPATRAMRVDPAETIRS